MLRAESGRGRRLGREGAVRLLLARVLEIRLVFEWASACARLQLKRTSICHELVHRSFISTFGSGFIHDLARQALRVEHSCAIQRNRLDERCI